MESQLVSSYTAGPTGGAVSEALARQQQQQQQQTQQRGLNGTSSQGGWASAYPTMGGYAPAPAPGGDAGALAAAAYGRWAYEHGASYAAPPPQPPPPQHPTPGHPPQSSSPQAAHAQPGMNGAWQGAAGGGYWPTAAATATATSGYYAPAPVATTGASDSADSSDDGGGAGGGGGGGGGGAGGAVPRKSRMKKPLPHSVHLHHSHAAAAAARESSELEKRLKKNAREQKRANKINDQIAIMKSLLEGVGLRPPATKSSILSEGIALVRHLLAATEPEKLAALRAKAPNGMFAPGGEAGEEAMMGSGSSSMDTGGSLSVADTVSSSGGGALGGGGEREPYMLLFRKSATPLAMAELESHGGCRFLDCNLRFAEVFKITPSELQQGTLPSFTMAQDANKTRRVLALLSQGGVEPDESSSTEPLDEVVLTSPQGQRFLVRVSALADDGGRRVFLLFTPKATLRSNGAGAAQGEEQATATATAAAAAATMGANGNGHSHHHHHHHQQQQQARAGLAGTSNGSSSSLGSTTSNSDSSSGLYQPRHAHPYGSAGRAPLVGGPAQAAMMAAVRTLSAHISPT